MMFSVNEAKSTPNFELELEMFLKEPASTDFIKIWHQTKCNINNDQMINDRS